ncbi:MAG: hypothetical protein IT379_39985 [Deltaproteobacteria bacterium]|nr:hypothetical protein [Deltaproteobacteria bacterium]
MRSLSRLLGALTLLAFAFSLVGCEITADDIERWKGTVKGPRKIVAVLLAPKYSAELRSKAALALVEMASRPEPEPFEGLAQLQRAMPLIEEAKRQEIIHMMIPRLVALMRGEGSPVRSNPDGTPAGPTELQTRAKDAAFTLLSHAAQPDRQQLTQAILQWIAEDFNGRSLAGNYSAEQVVQAIGQPAAAFLVNALNARMPPEALEKVAQLIGQLGDAESKRAGAARLVAIELEMESPAYGQWLRQKVVEQAEAQRTTLTPEQTNRVVEHNRDQLIRNGALPAMKHLASERAVVDRLLAIGLSAQAPAERRAAALIAAKDRLTRADAAALTPLALNGQTPVDVRDEVFDRIAEIRDPSVLPQFHPLLVGEDIRVRWRVAELMLQVGGAAQIPELFTRLPSREAQYPPGELSGIASRIGTLSPLPTEVMRGHLRSPQWFIRIIAIRFFERKGSAADVPSLEQLTADTAPCVGEGWEAGSTVGRIATGAIETLRGGGQQARPNAPSPAPAPPTAPPAPAPTPAPTPAPR